MLCSNVEGILKLLDGKKYRGIEVFKSVTQEMAEQKYFRTAAEQIRTKLKHLRKEFVDTKKHTAVSGADRRECAFFNVLNEIYGERPVVITPQHGVESDPPLLEEGIVEEFNNNCENEPRVEKPPKRARNSTI